MKTKVTDSSHEPVSDPARPLKLTHQVCGHSFFRDELSVPSTDSSCTSAHGHGISAASEAVKDSLHMWSSGL